MKRLLLLLALICGWTAHAVPAQTGMLLDSYAALVNGKVITVGDVLAAMQRTQEKLVARYDGAELRQRLTEEYRVVRDRLVEAELILQEFAAQGGVLPDRAIEDHINSVIHEQFNNDRAAFLRALTADRLTFNEWRKQMKDQLIVQYMRGQEVTAKILITPLDLQQAYDRHRESYARPERVRLRTLVLPARADPEAEATARDQAQALRQQIAEGNLAFDAAPGTLADPEWFEIAALNAAIRNAVAPLHPGDVAGPIELADSLYLVELLEREKAHILPFADAATGLERELRQAEFERLNRIWIDSLRSKYFVQLFTHDLFD